MAKPVPERPALQPNPGRTAVVRDPYARWCGRGGTVRCPPIPINARYADVGITKSVFGLAARRAGVRWTRDGPDRAGKPKTCWAKPPAESGYGVCFRRPRSERRKQDTLDETARAAERNVMVPSRELANNCRSSGRQSARSVGPPGGLAVSSVLRRPAPRPASSMKTRVVEGDGSDIMSCRTTCHGGLAGAI
jgi:hypothetical protein